MKEKAKQRGGVIPYFVNEDGTFEMMFMLPSGNDPKFASDVFQIAKGNIDKGEDLESGAFREAQEELGLFLPNISKRDFLGKFGNISIWIAKIKDKNQFGKPHWETETTKWMTPAEFQSVGRDIHRPIVKAAVRMIENQLTTENDQALTEIEQVVDQMRQLVNLKAFDFVNGAPVAKGEGGLPIVKSEHAGVIGFAIIKDNFPVASVYGSFSPENPSYFFIKWAWVEPKYRRQGLLSALYSGLVRRVHLTLVSDNEQGPTIRALWKNLLPDRQKVWNATTKEVRDRKDVPDEEIYGKDKRHIHLMIEATQITIPSVDGSLSVPLAYHERVVVENLEYDINEDAIGDYEKYTHSPFKGRFM